VAEIVKRTDITGASEDGWKCVYEIKRDDGELVTAEVRSTRTAEQTAQAQGNSKALESMKNYGGADVRVYAEHVQSPSRRVFRCLERSCSWRFGGCVLAAVGALCWVGVAGAATRGPTTLAVGQAVGVSGTDMVCAFGGPANQIGLACLHTSSTAKSAYSFRIDETRLVVFRRAKGRTVQLRAWTEPSSAIAQAHSAAVANFTSVGEVSAGSQFDAAGTDLACSVYTFKGTVQVACFKRNAKGILNGSYAVALGGTTMQVSRFQALHGTTVFVGK
jgi:hypothetical protein